MKWSNYQNCANNFSFFSRTSTYINKMKEMQKEGFGHPLHIVDRFLCSAIPVVLYYCRQNKIKLSEILSASTIEPSAILWVSNIASSSNSFYKRSYLHMAASASQELLTSTENKKKKIFKNLIMLEKASISRLNGAKKESLEAHCQGSTSNILPNYRLWTGHRTQKANYSNNYCKHKTDVPATFVSGDWISYRKTRKKNTVKQKRNHMQLL